MHSNDFISICAGHFPSILCCYVSERLFPPRVAAIFNVQYIDISPTYIRIICFIWFSEQAAVFPENQ
jgi:hypothetical protein